ncbi:MAG: DUF47 family protein [Candidatus Ozemobacteraceae bacterium]
MNWFFSKIRKLIAFLLPREERFFDQFLEMLEISKYCIELIKNVEAEKVHALVEEIEKKEEQSDELEDSIHQKLRASITTPPQLTRESILEIASTIDDVTDSLKSLSKRLVSGNGEIVNILKEKVGKFREMLDKLGEGVDLCIVIMKDFSDNKIEPGDPRLQRVHRIENEIDALHMQYVTETLYHSVSGGKEIVVMEVIGRIEHAGDELQRLVKIIEGVLASG